MNRKISGTCVVLVIGVVCLGLLAGQFARQSRAAPGSSNTAQSALPGDAKNVEMVNSLGGWSHEIAVVGNYVYLAIGQKLLVLDVSDPANPVPVSKLLLPRVATDLVVDGDILYVAAGDAGIRVVDISNPSMIAEIGSYEMDPDTGYRNNKVHHLAIAADRVYATYEGGELRVLDVANPALPVQIGITQLSGEGLDIVIVGDYAYVAIDNLGLTVLDISDPTHPSEAGEFISPIWKPTTGLALSGNLIVLARGCTIQLVDISQPVDPQGGATYTLAACSPTLADVEVSGSFVYLVTEGHSMGILEIIDFQTISEVFANSMDVWMSTITVVGNFAYAGGLDAFVVLDLTTPSTPEYKGRYEESGRYYEIVASGNYAYATTDDANGELVVWDISDPSGLIQVGVVPVAWAHYIAISGNYLL
jgi:hypothetical protein